MYSHAGWFDRIVFYHNNFGGVFKERILDPSEQVVCVSLSKSTAEERYLVVDKNGDARILWFIWTNSILEDSKLLVGKKQEMQQVSFPIDVWRARAHYGDTIFVESFSSLEVHGKDDVSGNTILQCRETEGVQQIQTIRLSDYQMPDFFVKYSGPNSLVCSISDGSSQVLFEEKKTKIIGLLNYID